MTPLRLPRRALPRGLVGLLGSLAFLAAACTGEIGSANPADGAALPDGGAVGEGGAPGDGPPRGDAPVRPGDAGPALLGDECAVDGDCLDAARPTCWLGLCVPPATRAPALAALAPNTWTLVEQSTTGGRNGPALVYVPADDRFLLAGGGPGGQYGDAVAHWATEELSLADLVWRNAYPAGAPAGYAPEVGPTTAPAYDQRGFADGAGVSRIGMFSNAYGADSRLYHQFALATHAGELLVHVWNETATYAPATRLWTDLDVAVTPTANAASLPRGTRTMIWGALGYDPVNRELVLIGGTAPTPGGTPGTWVFSLADRTWSRVAAGSTELNALRGQVRAEQERARRLVAALRHRFHGTETAADLEADRAALAAAVAPVRAAADAFAPWPGEAAGVERARATLAAAVAASGAFTVPATVAAATITAAQAVTDALERAGDALAAEPPARALAPLALSAATAELILFGGDGLDRHYADTWHYDCYTRTWRQVFPARSPAPRAGHALVPLIGQGRVLLAGGFGVGSGHSYMYGDVYAKLPFETWVYDPAAERWDRLALAGAAPEHEPTGDTDDTWPAAAARDDLVVMTPSGRTSRTTWALAPDVTLLDEAGAAATGVPPETVARRGAAGSRSYDPAFYEEGVTPDPGSGDARAAGLTPNVWTRVVPPKLVDPCGWGTTAMDPDRDELLFWGGGHSEYKGTNVFHHSLATGLWSSSSHPEWVLEWTSGFLAPPMVSFHDRPHIPVHAYQAYGYDPPSGLMLAVRDMVFPYDVRGREWQSPPLDPPFVGDVMYAAFETTPHGLYAWGYPQGGTYHEGALWRFDAAIRAFVALPHAGTLPAPWCDGAGMVYDSTRDALWLAPGNQLRRYDLATETLTTVVAQGPATLGDWALWREAAYVPAADVIVLARRFDAGAGLRNVAYDVTADAWYALDLPFSDGATDHNFSWSAALHHDARRGVLVLHDGSGALWMLKLDWASAAKAALP